MRNRSRSRWVVEGPVANVGVEDKWLKWSTLLRALQDSAGSSIADIEGGSDDLSRGAFCRKRQFVTRMGRSNYQNVMEYAAGTTTRRRQRYQRLIPEADRPAEYRLAHACALIRQLHRTVQLTEC
ncbi:hypothetical protein J6590_055375 [Homalodisca vitripennis]|nr:hypothetical protein J6590_055375 [Homalodisca vitripennis]